MILYITTHRTTNLLDFLEEKTYGPIKKLEGTFDMSNFVRRDMTNYLHITEIILVRDAADNSDDELIQSIREFHTMFNPRITIFDEKLTENNKLFKDLLEVGVGNIITSSVLKEVKDDIIKSMSEKGLERYEAKERAKPATFGESYKFECSDIRVGVIGSQSRIGVSTMGLGLAYWLNKVGGTSAYIDKSGNTLLKFIANEYGETYSPDGFDVENIHFTLNEPQESYNFKVYDLGVERNDFEAKTKDMDIIILMCGIKRFELSHTVRCLQNAGETKIYIHPTFFTEQLLEEVQDFFNNPLHTMLQPIYQPDYADIELSRVNYKNMIKNYIAAD
ncbi:MAG: hypothetical protein R3Y24_02925 [Eubacteriales bacterium]